MAQIKIKKIFFSFLFFLWLFCISSALFAVSYSYWDCYGVPFDEKLIKLLNFENGVFIEVGANDGLAQSNTKLLEEYHGWTGILIEPSKSLFDRLCQNRPRSKCFQCALGPFEEEGTIVFGDFDGSLMSSIHGNRMQRQAEQMVPMRSLQSILDEVGLRHINLFSLDTEGYELNILKGIDFSRTKFDYLLIEIYQTQYDEIVSFLSEREYDMLESFSNYSHETNPGWDGTHNDYLFKHRE